MMNADNPQKTASGSAHHESLRTVSPKPRGFKDAASLAMWFLPAPQKKWPYYSDCEQRCSRPKQESVVKRSGEFDIMDWRGRPTAFEMVCERPPAAFGGSPPHE